MLPALLLALMIPLAIGILEVTSMGSAALPVMFAFGILGRRIARAEVPRASWSRCPPDLHRLHLAELGS